MPGSLLLVVRTKTRASVGRALQFGPESRKLGAVSRFRKRSWLTPVGHQARIVQMTPEAAPSTPEKRRGIVQRWGIWAIIAVVVLGALVFRCLHLLYTEHYYLISPDSYFFHWLAGRVAAGEGPPLDAPLGSTYTLHSGLAYPLAYIAKAVGGTTGGGLLLASIVLPLAVGLISMAAIYLAADRAWNRRVAVFAAFSWALMINGVFLGAAGMLDREGLTTLLLLLGGLLFCFSRGWRFPVRGRNLVCLAAGAGVLAIEVALYVEWGVVGAALLLLLLGVYVVVRSVLEFVRRAATEPNARQRIRAALGEANIWTFAVIVLGNALLAAAMPSLFSAGAEFLAGLVRYSGQFGVRELQPLTAADLGTYYFFLIPMVIGLVIAVRGVWKGQNGLLLFSASWFLLFLILGFFSRRTILFAAPAASIISAIGLAYVWGWMKSGQMTAVKKAGVGILLVALILVSLVQAAALGLGSLTAADREWRNALGYMKEETPENAVIMSQWGWGYWILDVGERRPFVDNGYYGYDAGRLRDVSLAYAATEPSDAAEIMQRNGVSYLVFSKLDTDVAGTILGWSGSGDGLTSFPQNSLVSRSLNGEFESGGGLQVVYRSEPKSEVVILGLAQGGQPDG